MGRYAGLVQVGWKQPYSIQTLYTEFRSVVAANTPLRRWMLPQSQLLTEARFLNFEDFFISLYQVSHSSLLIAGVLTHLFLNPEAQRSLWFDALLSFMLDFRSDRAGRRLIFGRLDSLFLCILL
jgi:hypothetical protein